MKKNTWRIPLGFLAGVVFIVRADPVWRSFAWGAAVMTLGEFIRFISAGTLIKFEGVTRKGIYAFVRNPLYLGSLLIGLGACLIGRDLLFAALFTTAYPLVYYRIVRREESHLVRRYGGDYERYLAEVPRFLPRRFDPVEIIRETAPFLAIKNREYKTVLGIVSVWLIMLADILWL
ncbi:MAG: isoprenylcysteine carboxylmethyltransferase family protein [Candidatus Latescibacteria bacterium]|nr:isoprenylcysteine carboxylmethyltransferase family protein [Candidatus Latescibacterota bacterium]